MKVYGVASSPFVQRVLMAARAKGHELELVTPPGGALDSAEFMAISPMARIPVLEDGDLHICESATIVAHIDETLEGPPLLPAQAADRARARSIAQLAEGELAAGLRPLFIQKAFAGPASPALLEAGQAQAVRGLDALERLLDATGPWATGPAASVADFALAPLLVIAEVLEGLPGVPPIVGTRPRLRAYREHIFNDSQVLRMKREMEDGLSALIAAPQTSEGTPAQL